ncbi:MAG: hypothetical protein ABIK47_01580 [candidate division WOR-3 bacterium]
MKSLLLSFLVIFALAFGQNWVGPYQLTDNSADDINPSVCQEWVVGDMTWLVWQTNRNGNWDIYSKSCSFYNGNGWGNEIPVCVDSGDDVNPVVVSMNDAVDHPSFWCFWERMTSPVSGSILGSYITFRDVWSEPVEIGRTLHSPGESSFPSAIAIRGQNGDTIWVAWVNHDTGGYSIEYAFNPNPYNPRDSWYGPFIAVATSSPIHHARIGRGRLPFGGQACPVLTWEQENNIFYSWYMDGSWTRPQEVAPSPALDQNPEIISYHPLYQIGPWITWESMRDGDTAIYGTAMDTFSIGRRWCQSGGAGVNLSPCGTPAFYTTENFIEPRMVVWTTDRNGNFDIYSSGLLPSEDNWVDTNPAMDINPALTTIGVTQNWCVWQSNRNGNWDIFGSYIYATGMTENGRQKIENFGLRPPVFGHFEGPGVLLNASGQKVAILQPGLNKLNLCCGIYFLVPDKRHKCVKILMLK